MRYVKVGGAKITEQANRKSRDLAPGRRRTPALFTFCGAPIFSSWNTLDIV
jgi:hypothetical protein